MDKKNKFMELALQIAFDCIGNTSPNPSVGAVIVKDDHIISTGGTLKYGSDHAEVVAIKKAIEKIGGDKKHVLKGSEIYITLEPCNHFGKTPPCTEAIIKSGISKVYIPMLDPNPNISSKGVAALEKAGIKVEILSDYTDNAIDIIRHFEKYILKNKPFIIDKKAMSLDGRIATVSGDSKWISSVYSRYIVHKLRAKVDAIIVGKNTFILDNPSLTVRIDSFIDEVVTYFQNSSIQLNGRDNFFIKGLLNFNIKQYVDPLRVIIGLPDKIDLNYNMFKDNNYVIFARPVHFENFKKNKGQINENDLNIIIIEGTSDSEQVEFILKKLKDLGVMSAILEGGATVSGLFLMAGEIDQFLYTISPKVAGNGINSINSNCYNTVSDWHNLHDITSLQIKDDILFSGYSKKYDTI